VRAKHPIATFILVLGRERLRGCELGGMCTNEHERVQNNKEKCIQGIVETGRKRKEKWYAKAKEREFVVGEEVLLRKPGMNFKLEETWEGLYKIFRKNSPLSYGVDTGDRRIQSVHVQLMIKYCKREEALRVDRATTVLEQDGENYEITRRYTDITVEGDELMESQQIDIDEIAKEYETTLTKEPGMTDLVQFSIDTGDSAPISQRPYNTPNHFRDSVDAELDWLLDKGYIRRSISAWASPIVCVSKPDESARLCVNYKRINAVTTPQSFYMPHVEEVLESVGKARFISKMDLAKGYYQIRVREDDIGKTAFVCHRGRYEFTRMPFGVMNAPAIFQELMQDILRDDAGYCTPYMDDIIVFSESWEQHTQHIRQVLEKLRTAGLTANPKKCRWGGRTMEFLGH